MGRPGMSSGGGGSSGGHSSGRSSGGHYVGSSGRNSRPMRIRAIKMAVIPFWKWMGITAATTWRRNLPSSLLW